MMWIFRKNREHIGLETLSEYLDGRLSASQAQQLEGHVEACDRCGLELESLRDTVGLLRQVPMLEPRTIFTVGEAPSPAPARPMFRVPTWAYGAAASVAVLFFALVTTADLGGLLAGEAASTKQSSLESEAPVQSTPHTQPTQVASQAVPAPTATVPSELFAQAPQPTLVPENVDVAQGAAPVAPPVVKESVVSDQTSAAAADGAPPAEGEPKTELAAPAPSAPETPALEDPVAKALAGSDAPTALPAPAPPEPAGTAETQVSEPIPLPPQVELVPGTPEATPARVATPTVDVGPTQAPSPTVERDESDVPTPLPAATEAPAPAAPAEPQTAGPVAVTADGGTSVLWHVLEGVLAAVALALAGALLWRSGRFRGGRAA